MAQTTCDSVIYWIGSTIERFTISTSLLNESSNITIDPNSGTNVGGTQLDFSWVTTNFSVVNKYTFRGDVSRLIDTTADDAHVLIIVPTDLEVTNIGESVMGTSSIMTEELHYDIFQITNNSITYDVYYIRDLTSLVLPKRQFQFDISIA